MGIVPLGGSNKSLKCSANMASTTCRHACIVEVDLGSIAVTKIVELKLDSNDRHHHNGDIHVHKSTNVVILNNDMKKRKIL